jgi:hypothetical protein
VTEFKVEEGGKTYLCHFTVKSGIVTVHVQNLSKATQVGGSPPLTVARMMARELIREAGLK